MSDVFPIQTDLDIVPVRARARELASGLGFPPAAVEGVATAITEIARNIVVHAGGTGTVALSIEPGPGASQAIVVVASDAGPGIVDVARALEDGFSTGGGLGLGLPSARRLVDDFEIASTPGVGTTVIMRKWKRRQGVP